MLKYVASIIPWPIRGDGALGVAKKKREYDIPLHRKMGSEFLTLLIGLMTFLAILALASGFVLSSLTERWTTGLENRLTVEIPAETNEGEILSLAQVIEHAREIEAALQKLNIVDDVKALSESEVKELLAPWLGADTDFEDIPLPGLVSVRLHQNFESHKERQAGLGLIQKTSRDIVPNATLNAHKEWLDDIVGFAGALELTALLLVMIIGLTTFTAVAGAIKSRIATHYEELELLHLMGASDDYISRQFQRHAFILALQGSLAGMAVSVVVLHVIGMFARDFQEGFLPDFSLGNIHYIIFMTVPLVIGLIAVITARKVSLKELAAMP